MYTIPIKDGQPASQTLPPIKSSSFDKKNSGMLRSKCSFTTELVFKRGQREPSGEYYVSLCNAFRVLGALEGRAKHSVRLFILSLKRSVFFKRNSSLSLMNETPYSQGRFVGRVHLPRKSWSRSGALFSLLRMKENRG